MFEMIKEWVSWKFSPHTTRSQQRLLWGKTGKPTKPDENDHTVNRLPQLSNDHSTTTTPTLNVELEDPSCVQSYHVPSGTAEQGEKWQGWQLKIIFSYWKSKKGIKS